MGSRKDLSRILSGLSLVAKEFALRSDPLRAALDGDVPRLLRSVVRTAVVSATDITGLTRGTTRALPQGNAGDGPGGKESESNSIVNFDHTDTTAAAEREWEGGSRDGIKNRTEAAVVDAVVSEGEGSSGREARMEVGVGAGEFQQRESVLEEGEVASASASAVVQTLPVTRRKPRERRVPSTPFTRALGFAGLGAGLAWGTLQESTRRLVYGVPKTQDNRSALSPFLSDKNAERLALALCRMRGAALKLGQMLSIQDESLVPTPVRNLPWPGNPKGSIEWLCMMDFSSTGYCPQGADVMPRSQLNQVLDSELGTDWRSKLASFDYEPMAAASIGQVHRAVTKDDLQVAMKIQYPGVADSIESDIENVKLLLNYTNLIPEGLFLDRAMKVAKEELSRECDYELEAMNQKRFRDLLSGQDGFYVPMVLDDISSKRVLTSELVSGVPIDKVALLDEKTRNYVGRMLLELTLMELFVFRFMQTDPNWSNFLYDEERKTINLIDFGAARDYPKRFVDDYLSMVVACASKDRDAISEMSQRLGFLTGTEPDVMLDAHVQAGFIVGLPFADPGGFDFRKNNITRSVSNLGATMLRHRLTPPPDEAYSLHRKLSGAFLACMKLGAVVPCREMLLRIYKQYRFDDEDNSRILSKGSGF